MQGGRWLCGLAAAALFMLVPQGARAADVSLGLWFNPSVSAGLGPQTRVELETAQRLRFSREQGDTFYGRLWLFHRVSPGVRVGAAVEQRGNTDGADETRLIQQVDGRFTILRGRMRLEQRMVEGTGRTGWRLRPQAGVAVPLDGEDGKWEGFASVEGFVTLEPASARGARGLTGLRTVVGVERELSDRVSLGVAWLRQQDIVRGGRDTIGHAPFLELEISL